MTSDGKTTSIKGTPHYMAPEVVYDYSGYSCTVDYWSLAVVLYEIVCGYLPFGESYENPQDIYSAVMNE